MAIVLDEFGGTAGLVTSRRARRDRRPHRREQYRKSRISSAATTDHLAQGRRIDDLNDLFDLQIEEPDADTVGGPVMNRLGRIPPSATPWKMSARFRVEAVTGLRVSREAMQLATLATADTPEGCRLGSKRAIPDRRHPAGLPRRTTDAPHRWPAASAPTLRAGLASQLNTHTDLVIGPECGIIQHTRRGVERFKVQLSKAVCLKGTAGSNFTFPPKPADYRGAFSARLWNFLAREVF